MRKSDVDETLAQLYLRLNGYFTTGLIVHSSTWGEARTELDCLAIRHPNHSQSDRGVDTSEFLGVKDDGVDIVLCEVKSDPRLLRFNDPVKGDREILCDILRWAGMFSEKQVDSVADRLQPLLQDDAPIDDVLAGVVEGSFRVRPLLCCPPSFEALDDKWCLTGTEIFRFADKCFNPPDRRETCSTRYNFDQWGYPFARIIRYFKDNGIADESDLEGLYEHLGAA